VRYQSNGRVQSLVNLGPKSWRDIVGPNAIISRRGRKIYTLLGSIILLAALYRVMGSEVRADSQNHVDRQPASPEPLVIQGRITGIQDTLVTVKVPDGYPRGGGGHAQFVTAGPVFRVDISRARVLLPDGKQTDKLPLAVGDRVLMVLTGPDAGSAEPGSVRATYSASIVERVVQGDKIITH
jgi:hypothetical protein